MHDHSKKHLHAAERHASDHLELATMYAMLLSNL